MDEYKALLALIREVREGKGITQVEMASRLKITQSQYSKLERGERRVDILETHWIASALGMSTIELIHQWMMRIGRTESGSR